MSSVYTSWKLEDLPPELKPFYDIQYTGDQGCDTMRDKFSVQCIRCGTVLHKNTTGPQFYIQDHENNCKKK